jgi:ribonuclease J
MENNTNAQTNTNNSPSTNNGGRRFNNNSDSRRSNNSHSRGGQSSGGHGGGGSRKRKVRQPSLRSTIRQTRRNKDSGKTRPSESPIPEVGENIRIVPLGGVEEIGKNMTAIEIGDDIIVIDAGFQFKDTTTPGIDFMIPNTKYLEERKDRIRAMFITHGHLDHIGAVPYVLEKLGNPVIYSRQFGALMVQKKMEDFPHLPKANITVLDGDETITAGKIKVETFSISHTIPDSMGLIIDTPYGKIVFILDVRVDNVDGVPTAEEVKQYERFKDMDILLLTMDSTSVEKQGFSISENVVIKNIDKIIKETDGRLIIGTFASQVERIISIIEIADKYGKKIIFEGRSMKSNMEIVKYLGLVKTDNIVPLTEMENIAPDKVVMLVTGAQGEEFAALMRMANESHKQVKLRAEDTILLSSSIIPTNHTAVVGLKDRLYRSNAKIITYLDSDVHASGHGNREELKWIHEQIPYKYFIPLHGFHYLLRLHADLSESLGVPKENIVIPDNGSIIEIQDNGQKLVKLPMMAEHDVVTVDGFAVGAIQDVVIEDRQLLSEAGIFVIVASLNTRTGKLKKSPDIISRGFVYLRESQDLLRKSRNITKDLLEDYMSKNRGPVDFDKMKKMLTDEISKFLLQETAKQPLVIPVLLAV